MVCGVVDDASAAFAAVVNQGLLPLDLSSGSPASRLMVVDLGGTVVQASILETAGHQQPVVVETACDRNSGSAALHTALVDHFAMQFALANGIDLRGACGGGGCR